MHDLHVNLFNARKFAFYGMTQNIQVIKYCR